MKKANIVLDNKSTGLTIIEKMDYEGIDAFHDALCFAFYPDGIKDDDEDLDVRFLALWNIFLSSVGWTEDEYWDAYKLRPRHCPDCGTLMDKDGNHVDKNGVLIDEDDGQTPSESKPN